MRLTAISPNPEYKKMTSFSNKSHNTNLENSFINTGKSLRTHFEQKQDNAANMLPKPDADANVDDSNGGDTVNIIASSLSRYDTAVCTSYW